MKKLFALGLLLISGVLFAAHNNYLFVQAAPQATLIHEKGDNYKLVLSNSPPDVWYFTDRPVRKSGAISTQKFSELWLAKTVKQNFTAVPPNAAIVLTDAKNLKTALVAELSKPNFSANTVTYSIHKISKNAVNTGSFNQAMLFIDNMQWGPGGF